jgi:hypothetical protein
MRIVLVAAAATMAWAGTARAQAPVGQWRFDEGSGTTVHDTSGSGLDGAILPGANGGAPTWVTGISGSALHFDGHGAVALPDSTLLEPTRITVAAWARRAGSPGNYRYIVSKGATACYTSSYALYTAARGSVAFYVSSGGHYTLSDQPAPSAVWDGRWHRLVGTYDGRDVRLFVDGRQVGADVAEPGGIDYGLTTRGPYIGTYRGGCRLPFSGDIDTVEIYDAALDDAAIAADAGLPAGSAPPPLPGSGGGSLPAATPPSAGGQSTPGTTVQAGCLWLKAEPRSVRAGRRARIGAMVRVHGRPRAHVRLVLRAHRLRATTLTDRRGRAQLRVRVPRATRRLTLSARATRTVACTRTATVTIPVRP